MPPSGFKKNPIPANGSVGRPPGRPRNLATENRILDVTLQQLQTEGYNRMSIDSVARMAGVSKPTIYRRWKGKEDLATAALARLRGKEAPVSQTETREELVGVLRNFRKSLLRPHGLALVGTVLAEERHTPELLRLFRERLVQPRRQALCSALQRGMDRGEVRRDCDLTVAVNLLVGSFYAAYLAGDSIPPSWPRRSVDCVWRGVSQRGDV